MEVQWVEDEKLGGEFGKKKDRRSVFAGRSNAKRYLKLVVHERMSTM